MRPQHRERTFPSLSSSSSSSSSSSLTSYGGTSDTVELPYSTTPSSLSSSLLSSSLSSLPSPALPSFSMFEPSSTTTYSNPSLRSQSTPSAYYTRRARKEGEPETTDTIDLPSTLYDPTTMTGTVTGFPSTVLSSSSIPSSSIPSSSISSSSLPSSLLSSSTTTGRTTSHVPSSRHTHIFDPTSNPLPYHKMGITHGGSQQRISDEHISSRSNSDDESSSSSSSSSSSIASRKSTKNNRLRDAGVDKGVSPRDRGMMMMNNNANKPKGKKVGRESSRFKLKSYDWKYHYYKLENPPNDYFWGQKRAGKSGLQDLFWIIIKPQRVASFVGSPGARRTAGKRVPPCYIIDWGFDENGRATTNHQKNTGFQRWMQIWNYQATLCKQLEQMPGNGEEFDVNIETSWDDISKDPTFYHSPIMREMTVVGRWYRIGQKHLVHKVTMVSPLARENHDQSFIFNPGKRTQMRALFDELVDDVFPDGVEGFRQWIDMLRQYTTNFGVLVFDCNSRSGNLDDTMFYIDSKLYPSPKQRPSGWIGSPDYIQSCIDICVKKRHHEQDKIRLGEGETGTHTSRFTKQPPPPPAIHPNINMMRGLSSGVGGGVGAGGVGVGGSGMNGLPFHHPSYHPSSHASSHTLRPDSYLHGGIGGGHGLMAPHSVHTDPRSRLYQPSTIYPYVSATPPSLYHEHQPYNTPHPHHMDMRMFPSSGIWPDVDSRYRSHETSYDPQSPSAYSPSVAEDRSTFAHLSAHHAVLINDIGPTYSALGTPFPYFPPRTQEYKNHVEAEIRYPRDFNWDEVQYKDFFDRIIDRNMDYSDDGLLSGFRPNVRLGARPSPYRSSSVVKTFEEDPRIIHKRRPVF